MKLTAQRLKKLIREELNEMEDGQTGRPPYGFRDTGPMIEAIENIKQEIKKIDDIIEKEGGSEKLRALKHDLEDDLYALEEELFETENIQNMK